MKAVTSNDCRARIERVLAHLADHLDADLSVAELARIAHFSPYHFHRLFRALVGETWASRWKPLEMALTCVELPPMETFVTSATEI